MSNTLVIVESPAKCKKIESYLGPGYKVIASFGHIRHIKDLESIDINNNFATKYDIIQETIKLKQIEKIREEISKSKDVIIATDDDREGEAIGWHICDLFGLSIESTKRIIFHEITEPAIHSAIAYPKKINMELVNSQQTRQILDMLIGYTITPILWNNFSKKCENSLSAGRCQTPALRLVYDNYLDIKASSGKIVYNIYGYFTNLNLCFELNKQIETEEMVKNFLGECNNFAFIYSNTSPKKVIKKAPEPLTTSTLQQLTSNELHWSPKETMKYAQQLYEAGYITYMRTDSKKYSKEFIEKTKTYILSKYGEQYVSGNINNLVVCSLDNKEKEQKENKESKKTKKQSVAEKKGIPKPQEAHEAIRPVDVTIKDLSDVDAKAVKLYGIIWKRTLESCMSSSQFSSVTAKITAPLSYEFLFKSEINIFPGWQIVENKIDDETSKVYNYIISLKQDIEMSPKKIESNFTMINLKSHYTEARLVQLLEEEGIGRPSTFASLVDKIQERKYVEKTNITGEEIQNNDYIWSNNEISQKQISRTFGNEKNKLVMLPLGILIIQFLINNFDMFFNYDYTKDMEQQLDLIAKGELVWINVCNNCNNMLNNVLNSDKMADIKKFEIVIETNYKLIIGKHGPVIKHCATNNPRDITFLPVKKDLDLNALRQRTDIKLQEVLGNNNVSDDSETHSLLIGSYKGEKLYVKNGKYGVYAKWGKETKSLKEKFDGKLLKDIDYIEVLRYLDKDTLDPSKPPGLLRELTPNLSIRTSKHGDYIFYKTMRMKTPMFIKLSDFKGDYLKCDKELILNWLRQTHNIKI
jgi:DNA topoisomerase-1